MSSETIFTLCKHVLLMFEIFLSLHPWTKASEEPESRNASAERNYASIETSPDFGVFYSFTSILDIFNNPKYCNDTPVRQLMKTYQETYPYDPRPYIGRRRPFIVIESTRRDCRRSVGWMLARSIGARYLSNPPRSLVPLRDLFDDAGGLLRRAFFSLCMYAAAHDVAEIMYRFPVVMAGYWHDQAAFALAKEFLRSDLPPSGSELYRWPRDLLVPDVTFFVNAPDRSPQWNAPKANDFKPKLIEVMRRMRGPPIIEINDTYLYDEILMKIQEHLDRGMRIKLPFHRVYYKDIIGEETT